MKHAWAAVFQFARFPAAGCRVGIIGTYPGGAPAASPNPSAPSAAALGCPEAAPLRPRHYPPYSGVLAAATRVSFGHRRRGGRGAGSSGASGRGDVRHPRGAGAGRRDAGNLETCSRLERRRRMGTSPKGAPQGRDQRVIRHLPLRSGPSRPPLKVPKLVDSASAAAHTLPPHVAAASSPRSSSPGPACPWIKPIERRGRFLTRAQHLQLLW